MDETGGPLADSSGNGNDAALSGGGTYGPISGKIGGAGYFDGSLKADVPYNTDTTGLTNVTYSIWLKPQLNEGEFFSGCLNGEMASGAPLFEIDNNGSEAGKIKFLSWMTIGGVSNIRTVTIAPYPVNTWVHFVYTYDGSAEKIYVNGSEAGSWAKTGALHTNTECGLQIGHGYLSQYTGGIDDVRLYNRALTDDDIALLYSSFPGPITCNAAHEAVMMYNNDEKVMQYCDGTEWISVGNASTCKNYGDLCSDGTIYAGTSPDGNVPMYTTPADAGQFSWDDGVGPFVSTAMSKCTSTSPGADPSCQTGKANTDLLVSLGTTTSPAPYMAAQYCHCLGKPATGYCASDPTSGANGWGYSDWYLPAQDELNVLYVNLADAGPTAVTPGNEYGFNTAPFSAGWYWASSEGGTANGRVQSFDNAGQLSASKKGIYNVRCVRKSSAVASTSCSSPDADAGTMIYNYNEGVLQYCNGENWISMGPKTAQSGASADDLSPAAPSSGLIGHWPLDGDATDSAGSNDGTLNNAPTWDSGGKIGGGIQLDGIDQYISTSSISASNPATITVAAWFKADTWGDEDSGCIICINNGGGSDNIQIRLLNDSGQQGLRTFFRGSGDGGQANVHNAVTLGQWHHVAVTYDAGGTRIPLMYIDGLPVSSYDLTGAATGGHSFTTLNAHIGADAVPNRFFDGMIDDARVYNRVLTDDEVLALYKSNSLAGHWKLDETTGTTAADSSGNGLDGTLSGTDFDTSSKIGKNRGALHFDGSTHYVEYGTNIEFDDKDFTISAWVQRQGPGIIYSGNGNPIFSQRTYAAGDGNPNVSLNIMPIADGSLLQLQLRTTVGGQLDSYSTSAIPDNVWTHVAVTKTSDQIELYINGALDNTVSHTKTGDFDAGSSYRYIGRLEWQSTLRGTFEGLIDDVRIYNRALSSDEIADLYVATGGDGTQPVTGCSAIGDTCDDGTIYAGLSPDGNVPMYTTPADAPGGIAYAWNDGTTNWLDTAITNCTIGSPGPETGCQTGKANTDLLVGLNGSGTPAPYTAAEYCAGLAPPDAAALGHSDWYVPAQDELNVLYENLVDQDGDNTPGGPLGSTFGFNTSNTYAGSYYMSSSENSNAHAISQRFGDGNQQTATKSNDIALRCVRKGDKILISTCSSPYGEPGQIFYNDDENLMQYCNGESWIALAPPTGNATVVPGPDTTDPVWTTAAGTVDTINTGDSLSVTVTATDNSGTVTYSKTGGDAWISVNATTGELTGTAPGSAGTYSITVTATDPSGNTAARSFDVVVAADPCTTGAIGTMCTSDNAIYAGTTVGGVRLYAARCDEGQSWDGSACTGTQDTLSWKTTTTSTAGTGSLTDGIANTDAMATAGIADHPAAEACRNLGAQWYLPARDELDELYTNLADTGVTPGDSFSFDTSGMAFGGYYWSSSEVSSVLSWYQRYHNGDQIDGGKMNAFAVRCVRR